MILQVYENYCKLPINPTPEHVGALRVEKEKEKRSGYEPSLYLIMNQIIIINILMRTSSK